MRSFFGSFACLAMLMLSSFAFASGGNAETVGTLPGGGGSARGVAVAMTSNPGNNSGNTGAVTSVTVKPGQSGSCNGVACNNNSFSSGKAVIRTASSTTYSGFDGSITGVKPDYVVDLGSSNNASVTGTGGAVNLGNSGTTTVTNCGSAGGGGSNITVKYPSGGTASVPPGSSTTFHS